MKFRLPYRLRVLKSRLLRQWETEHILRARYRDLFGEELDSANLQTFTEKLYYRMILMNRHGCPFFTQLADKFAVRSYVAERTSPDYLIPLLWHGTDPRHIPFAELPAQCVIKTNHGQGDQIFLNQLSVDQTAVQRTLRKNLKENPFWRLREYQYYRIRPRILIETLIEDGDPLGPLDYRFWCFNGRPHLIQVDNRNHSINPFYDDTWRKLDLSYRTKFQPVSIPRPANLETMLSVASDLSRGIDFVRVDLYNSVGKIFFGELTLTPVGGKIPFTPAEWDHRLGELWDFDKHLSEVQVSR